MKRNELIMLCATKILIRRRDYTIGIQEHDRKLAVQDARLLYNEVLSQSKLNGENIDDEAFD